MTKIFLGIVIGALLAWLFWKPKNGFDDRPQSVRREQNLEKLLELVRSNGLVSNDDAEKALGVSNATAERYLQELERQGKLEQIGKTGRNVTYKLKQ